MATGRNRPYLNPAQVMYQDPTRSLQNVFARMGEERLANQKLAQGGSQFDARMGLDREKFAALQGQREIENALARRSAGNILTPEQKQKQWLARQGYLQAGRVELADMKGKKGSGKSGSTAALHGTAQYKGAHPDEQGQMDAALVGMMADNVSGGDALDAVLSNTKKSIWANPTEGTFYYDD